MRIRTKHPRLYADGEPEFDNYAWRALYAAAALVAVIWLVIGRIA